MVFEAEAVNFRGDGISRGLGEESERGDGVLDLGKRGARGEDSDLGKLLPRGEDSDLGDGVRELDDLDSTIRLPALLPRSNFGGVSDINLHPKYNSAHDDISEHELLSVIRL